MTCCADKSEERPCYRESVEFPLLGGAENRAIRPSDRWSQNINLWTRFSSLWLLAGSSARHMNNRSGDIHKASIFRASKKGEWNEILLILDTSMYSKRSCKEILRELQHRNYDNTSDCPIHTNLLLLILPAPAHALSARTGNDFSYQTLWWWQKSIENISSAT